MSLPDASEATTERLQEPSGLIKGGSMLSLLSLTAIRRAWTVAALGTGAARRRVVSLSRDWTGIPVPTSIRMSAISRLRRRKSSGRILFRSTSIQRPPRSTPYNQGIGSFVYGTLPVFITKVTAGIVGKDAYDGIHLVGRFLTASLDTLTISARLSHSAPIERPLGRRARCRCSMPARCRRSSRRTSIQPTPG